MVSESCLFLVSFHLSILIFFYLKKINSHECTFVYNEKREKKMLNSLVNTKQMEPDHQGERK